MSEKIESYGSKFNEYYLIRVPMEIAKKYGFENIEKLIVEIENDKILIQKNGAINHRH